MHLNIEIKAHCLQQDDVRQILLDHKADFKGTDHQIDTYFKVPNGRLKLREGNIEVNLIQYHRDDQSDPKASHVHLYQPAKSEELRAALTAALGIKVVVDKQREIYFIDNVKFHLDQVKELGTFVEIEAIDCDGSIGEAKLLEQCQYYRKLLAIPTEDLIENSYSDLLLNL